MKKKKTWRVIGTDLPILNRFMWYRISYTQECKFTLHHHQHQCRNLQLFSPLSKFPPTLHCRYHEQLVSDRQTATSNKWSCLEAANWQDQPTLEFQSRLSRWKVWLLTIWYYSLAFHWHEDMIAVIYYVHLYMSSLPLSWIQSWLHFCHQWQSHKYGEFQIIP